MMQPWALELLGYVASVLVAVSLMMSSILRLRLINLFGSAAFTVYGLLIGAYPVAAVNLFIVFINLYYLRGMLRSREYFQLLQVEPGSEYLGHFLDFHAAQVRRFFPGFAFDPAAAPLAVFVLRDLVPAGLLLGEVRGATLHVQLDFVIAQYRDFKIGRYLFVEQAAFFRERGVREILAVPATPEHAAYLRRMGFTPADAGPGGPGAPHSLRLAERPRRSR
jgi:GNAT superfamily N-acetyltransferase